MELLVLGMIPPTDIERRVRELQRKLYAERDLPEALALPVVIPLWVRKGLEASAQAPALASALAPPPGRLEAPRLVTGAFAMEGHWLLWSLQAAPGLRASAATWLDRIGHAHQAEDEPSRLPTESGFPLAFSPTPGVLEAALPLLGVEPPRTFQPRCLALYRLQELGREAGACRGWSWARVFDRGLFWEEIRRKPVRRQA